MSPEQIDLQCEMHQILRSEKNYEAADAIRDLLKAHGVIIECLRNGRTRWRYK